MSQMEWEHTRRTVRLMTAMDTLRASVRLWEYAARYVKEESGRYKLVVLFFFMWLRALSSTVSQSPTVSFEVLLTLSQRVGLQMYLSCLFRILHRIECVTSFFTVCAPCVHLDTLSIWCLWRFPRVNCAHPRIRLPMFFCHCHDPITHVRRARFLPDVAGPFLSVSLSLSLSLSSCP